MSFGRHSQGKNVNTKNHKVKENHKAKTPKQVPADTTRKTHQQCNHVTTSTSLNQLLQTQTNQYIVESIKLYKMV